MKNNFWFKSASYTFFNRFFTFLFGTLGFMILIRTLSKEEFGIWALFISVTALIEVARNGFIQNALIKFITSSDEKEKPDIITSSFILNIIISSFTILLIFLFAEVISAFWSAPLISPMLYYYSITTFILISYQQLNYLQQAYFDFKGFFYTNFVRQGSFLFFIYLAQIFEYQITLINLVNFTSISALLGLIVTYFFGRKYFQISLKPNFQWIRKLFHYGKYVFGTNISSMLYSSISQTIIGMMMPASSVAIFNSASRVNNLVDIPVSSIASVIFPLSSKKNHIEGLISVKKLYEKSVGYLLAIILPLIIFIIISAKHIIFFLAGNNYSEAISLLQLIIITSIFQPFMRQFGVTLDSIGQPRINFIVIITISIINAILTFMLIEYTGLMGAAIANIATSSLFTIIALTYLKIELKISINRIFFHQFSFYQQAFVYSKKILSKVLKPVIVMFR